MPDLPPSNPKYQVEIPDGRGVVIGGGAQVTQVIQAAPALEIPPPPEPERPPEVAEFVGREAELADYAERLRTTHLTVIAGEPGVGKTWLAARLAHQAVAPMQVFWYAFHEGAAGGAGIEALIWKLAAFLAGRGQDDLWRMLQSARLTGGQSQPPEVLFDYLIQLLRGRGYLLCLDDFQHVDEDPLVGRLVRRLTAIIAAGEISLVLTSRRIPAFVRAVKPLAGLSLDDARHLLAARGLSLTANLAADLHARTGGNPQLLTLAVNALAGCADPAQLVTRLVEETDIARYLMTEVHKCLTKEEQTVMVAIAILLGYRGTRNAIEAILDAGAWEALTSLGNRYLLSVAEGPHGREYGQHAIFQTFYYNQLGRRQQREMHRRAGAYYEREEPDLLKAASHFQRAGDPEAAARLATADVWALINQGQAGALRRLLEQFTPQQMGAELWARVNIARGQVYALHRESQLARQSFEQGLAVLEGMADSPEFRELASKQRDRTAQSNVRVRLRQELAEHFSEEELRTLCFDLGLDYENLPAQGKVGKARELIAEVERGESVAKLVELCRRARPNVLWEDGAAAPRPDNLPGWFVELKARVCLGMGELLLEQSAPEALAWLNRGLDEFADVSSLEAAALHIRIGVVQIHIGNLPVARDALQHGLDILPAGPSQWRAAGLINLGAIYCAQGNSELGKKCYQRALEISQQLGDHWRVVSALHNLAIEMEITGHWEDAIAEYQTALALAERLGSHLHQANLALSLGILMTKRGDYESAETYLLNCQTIAREHSLRLELVFVLPSLADLYLLQGKTAVAVSLLAEAEHLALETGAEGRLAEIHRVWAEVHLTQDRPGMAQEAAQRSVNLARKLELQSEEGMSLRVLGQALISGDQQEAALAAFERSLSLLIDQDPYEASRTKVQLGVALITSGNTVRGMPLLYEARGWFERLGARCDLAALDAILQ